jgi:hypothetical protein
MKNNNNNWKGKRKKVFFLLFVIAAAFVLAGIVMLLWNAVLPDLIHVSVITYWQALGLLLLCRILFGGFRFGRPNRGRERFGNPRFREKFMNMEPEEREAFKQKWKERCRK